MEVYQQRIKILFWVRPSQIVLNPAGFVSVTLIAHLGEPHGLQLVEKLLIIASPSLKGPVYKDITQHRIQ